jgi:hypothetical protein
MNVQVLNLSSATAGTNTDKGWWGYKGYSCPQTTYLAWPGAAVTRHRVGDALLWDPQALARMPVQAAPPQLC